MKKIILCVVVVIVLLFVGYFIIPVNWTFGLRPPGNGEECVKVGGKVNEFPTTKNCEFKGKLYYFSAYTQ
jgi:hypothetical protein